MIYWWWVKPSFFGRWEKQVFFFLIQAYSYEMIPRNSRDKWLFVLRHVNFVNVSNDDDVENTVGIFSFLVSHVVVFESFCHTKLLLPNLVLTKRFLGTNVVWRVNNSCIGDYFFLKKPLRKSISIGLNIFSVSIMEEEKKASLTFIKQVHVFR